MELKQMEVEIEVNQMEVEMELNQMELKQMEVERDLNRIELKQMEVKYNLGEIIGWQAGDYEKEDCELDLSFDDSESESCERSM
jgi:hypothetical protein